MEVYLEDGGLGGGHGLGHVGAWPGTHHSRLLAGHHGPDYSLQLHPCAYSHDTAAPQPCRLEVQGQCLCVRGPLLEREYTVREYRRVHHCPGSVQCTPLR